MAATCAHLRSLVQIHEDLGEILGVLNHALAVRSTDQHFVTFLLAGLDFQSGSLVYSNAGHPAGYVLDSSGEVKALLKSTGIPLAIVPDEQFFTSDPVALESGDTVILFTDGFTEARPPGGDDFGCKRVLEVVRANRMKPASEIIESLYCAVRDHTGQDTPGDDLTVVVIKVESTA